MSKQSAWLRVVAQVLAAVVLVVGGGYALFRVFVYEAPETNPTPTPRLEPAGVEQKQVVVVATRGVVESSRDREQWRAVEPGATLAANDSIRSGADSQADLQVGERSRVTLTSSSEVRVQEVTQAVHRFRLQRGRVAVDVQRDGTRVVRIEDQDGKSVAEATEAKFNVLNTGLTFAVATETGGVNLRAAGEAVDVGAGQESSTTADATPTPARAIPVQLLLKVAAASARPARETCAVVVGTVSASAEVRVNGELVAPDENGRFEHQVPRPEGRQVAVVRVRDATGREQTREVACVAPTKTGPTREKVRWGGGSRERTRWGPAPKKR